jgi:hypothetical protein
MLDVSPLPPPSPPPNRSPLLRSPCTSLPSSLGTDVVVRAGTHHSAVGATRSVGRIPPRPAGPGACDGRGTAKTGNRECVVHVLWLAIPAVVWARSRGLRAARSEG